MTGYLTKAKCRTVKPRGIYCSSTPFEGTPRWPSKVVLHDKVPSYPTTVLLHRNLQPPNCGIENTLPCNPPSRLLHKCTVVVQVNNAKDSWVEYLIQSATVKHLRYLCHT